MDYAMICKNRVIGILKEQEREPVWPPDADKNKIYAVLCGEGVEMGMEYDPATGEFNYPRKVETEIAPDPIMEKLDAIEEKIQTNEDLQTFYDEIVKEVGL